ncbi:MAG: hypothetical protein J6K28_03535 [Alistipes sp.]|nr:hypothetical protein [Alistipes sp.]
MKQDLSDTKTVAPVRESAFNIFKRYLTATVGLFVVAFGVAVSTRSNLGTSPISCPPYALSLWGGFTMGEYTIMMHILLICIQIALLRKKFRLVLLLQLAASFMFGYFTDLTMNITASWQSESIVWQFGLLLVGCIVLAIGIAMEVSAKAWMLPGEQTVAVIAEVTGGDFGKIKIWFDSTLVAIGLLLSIILLHKIEFNGPESVVGVGTVVAALLVGYVIDKIQPATNRLLGFLYKQ